MGCNQQLLLRWRSFEGGGAKGKERRGWWRASQGKEVALEGWVALGQRLREGGAKGEGRAGGEELGG